MPNWKKLIVSGSDASLNTLTVNNAVTAGSFVGDGSGLTNVSTGTTRYTETLTGQSSYTITHNLNENFPIVQVYDSGKAQVIPGSVISTNSNTITISFFSVFEGTVVVKK